MHRKWQDSQILSQYLIERDLNYTHYTNLLVKPEFVDQACNLASESVISASMDNVLAPSSWAEVTCLTTGDKRRVMSAIAIKNHIHCRCLKKGSFSYPAWNAHPARLAADHLASPFVSSRSTVHRGDSFLAFNAFDSPHLDAIPSQCSIRTLLRCAWSPQSHHR
jgi:hypothetical protein